MDSTTARLGSLGPADLVYLDTGTGRANRQRVENADAVGAQLGRPDAGVLRGPRDRRLSRPRRARQDVPEARATTGRLATLRRPREHVGPPPVDWRAPAGVGAADGERHANKTAVGPTQSTARGGRRHAPISDSGDCFWTAGSRRGEDRPRPVRPPRLVKTPTPTCRRPTPGCPWERCAGQIGVDGWLRGPGRRMPRPLSKLRWRGCAETQRRTGSTGDETNCFAHDLPARLRGDERVQ